MENDERQLQAQSRSTSESATSSRACLVVLQKNDDDAPPPQTAKWAFTSKIGFDTAENGIPNVFIKWCIFSWRMSVHIQLYQSLLWRSGNVLQPLDRGQHAKILRRVAPALVEPLAAMRCNGTWSSPGSSSEAPTGSSWLRLTFRPRGVWSAWLQRGHSPTLRKSYYQKNQHSAFSVFCEVCVFISRQLQIHVSTSQSCA